MACHAGGVGGGSFLAPGLLARSALSIFGQYTPGGRAAANSLRARSGVYLAQRTRYCTMR